MALGQGPRPRTPSIAAVQLHRARGRQGEAAVLGRRQHYQRLLARHARVTLIEVREDEQVERRIPDRAYVSLLDAGGREYTSEAFARWLEERRQGGRDVVLRGRRPVRDRARALRSQALTRRDDAPAPARAGRAARAVVPSAQDPRQRAVPSLTLASPVEELRAAVEAVTAELGNGAVTPTLERPRKAGFGDYSTNAAMLLAPSLKAPPREIAERLGAALQAAARRARREGRGRRARVPQRLPRRRLVHRRRRARARGRRRLGQRDRRGAGAGPDRVRLGESHRPADRSERPPRRVRRCARSAARVRRSRGRARVLLQRRRRAAAQARHVDPRARPRRSAARGRLPGRVCGRAGGCRSRAPPSATPRTSRSRAAS